MYALILSLFPTFFLPTQTYLLERLAAGDVATGRLLLWAMGQALTHLPGELAWVGGSCQAWVGGCPRVCAPLGAPRSAGSNALCPA